MISIKTQTNLAHAKSYFRDHLATGDYYSSTGATAGKWSGKGAGMLGLQGQVSEKDFLHLCAGEKPDGSRLTQRTNTVRQGDTANRRIFFDWTVAPPKSVSIAALVHGDDRIKEAHSRAIAKATAELEQFAAARVRSKIDPLNGSDRQTGNLCVANFTHETSRAIDEHTAPDPLLHTHMLVLNTTKDGEPWRALQTFEMLRSQKFIEAIYDHELCRELRGMGYGIRESANGWELAHISDATCQKFSKRRKAILEKTAELERAGAKSGHEKLKDHVAHDERQRKQGSMTAEALREAWKDQMTAHELSPNNLYSSVDIIGKSGTLTNHSHNHNSIADIIGGNAKSGSSNGMVGFSPDNPYSSVDIIATDSIPKDALDWSIKHSFERSAVVRDTDLLATALRSARGGSFSIEALKTEFEGSPSLLRELGGRRVTTENALETEKYILRSVKAGQGKFSPFAPALLPTAEVLNPLQRQAAESLLSSQDLITVFRGGAGTGKSFTLRHVSDAIEANGMNVVVLAPQNQQVQDLQADGFTAQTVSSYLKAPYELKQNSVLIVDEAGQIGGEDMSKLIANAKMEGARIILSGDVRQHSAISSTDALRCILRYASPHIAELRGVGAIQRQQEAQYKKAVACAESGDTETAWNLLDAQGSIRDTTIENRTGDAAQLYLEKSGSGSVLMLSQTNVEVEALNLAIRAELVKAGKLDPILQLEKSTLRAVDLTQAEKERAGSYPESCVVMLNRKVGQHTAGTTGKFLRVTGKGGVVLMVDGRELNVSQKDLGRLTVCEPRRLELLRGDKIQLKANCKIGRDRKLANGQILTVQGQDTKGRLVVWDAFGQKYSLPEDFRQFQYGYAVSSYASQGKTVDHVIISDSSCKAATSQKEFYVSISRGRKSCSLLTADRETLQDHICHLGEKDLASDLRLAGRPHTPEREIGSPVELKGLLGPAGVKERPVCMDERTCQRVELFGNAAGRLFVRGLASLGKVILKCASGVFRLAGVERDAENSR